MRIVFLGTPQFAVPVLQALLASPHQVAAAYTQPDRPSGRGRHAIPPPVKRLALEHGVPVAQPRRLRAPEEVARLRELAPELMVVAAFGQILSQEVLDIPPLGVLNVHPSLLPRHRGATPIPAAILAGDAETGATIMLLDAGMDTGPLLRQERIPIGPADTTASLGERLSALGARLLLESIPPWAAGQIQPQPQDSSKATYCKPLAKEEGELDWKQPAVTLGRRVRALDPWPGTFTRWQGKLLKVLEARPLPSQPGLAPGQVVAHPGKGLAAGVATGDGILGLLRVQLEGKRPLTGEEFLRGQRGFQRALLPS
ncbi:MAG: methionyl-tRNA formyltransferase [Chloroflexi bacterium]|nr:methionyl-tRNA formyltransferase [Chloroflexota bacterium]MBI4215959.1 methionyl-tRNA formyltransferase [Chloroflexota bacterium]